MGVPDCLVNFGIHSDLIEERGMCRKMHSDLLQEVGRGGMVASLLGRRRRTGDRHVPGGGPRGWAVAF